MTGYVIAGTGSRSLQVADNATKQRALDAVTGKLWQRLSGHPDLIVMAGAAEGFDACLATAALQLELPLWLSVPTHSYGPYNWGRKSTTGRNRLPEFQAILDRAWKVTYVMEDVHHTTGLYLNGVHSNFVRNLFMVQTAAEFLVWDPTSKGTAHCLTEIIKAGKPYEVLSPRPATLV